MIGAFDLGDFRAAGKGARRLDREHHGFGAGIDEPNAIEVWNPATKQFGQCNLDFGGICKAAPALQLSGHGLDHRRKCVTVNERGEIAIEIEKSPAIEIDKVTANAALDVAWSRVPLDGHTRRPVGEDILRARKTRFGFCSGVRRCRRRRRFGLAHPMLSMTSGISADLDGFIRARTARVASRSRRSGLSVRTTP